MVITWQVEVRSRRRRSKRVDQRWVEVSMELTASGFKSTNCTEPGEERDVKGEEGERRGKSPFQIGARRG